MNILLRHIIQDGTQTVFQDTEMHSLSQRLTMGSAADQMVQVCGHQVLLRHAYIEVVNSGFKITCTKSARIRFHNQSIKSAVLNVGDEFAIESHIIKIIKPPAGFKLALEINLDLKLQTNTAASSYITSLKDTLLSKRVPSYLLTIAILLAFVVWPLSAPYLRASFSAEHPDFLHIDKQAYGDSLWLSGPLTEAHQLALGNNCQACHQKPFEKVKDVACTNCHGNATHHFEQSLHDLQEQYDNMASTTCQSCHKEHNEPQHLVIKNDSLCIDCHQQSLENAANQTLAVTGFNKSNHPEFKLNFLLPKLVERGTGTVIEWTQHKAENSTGLAEQSNLKFPHDVHLNADKMRTSSSPQGMECRDCHSLNADNEHFAAISMEQHCSQCHDLSFDMNDIERKLPHGSTLAVIQTLEAHFVKIYANPDFINGSAKQRRRRPGATATEEHCTVDQAFSCGLKRAFNEADVQFTQRGCITCHQVTVAETDDLYTRWQVLPIKINHNWYSKARFNHASHMTQMGQTEQQNCVECHRALESSVSTDVLIPPRDTCLDCHSDQYTDEKISVNCITCHAFHDYNLIDRR